MTQSGQKCAGVSDKALDADIEAAQHELDPAKQQALWADMQRIYATQLLALPLYFRIDPDILPLWLTGYKATGKESYTNYWAENWGTRQNFRRTGSGHLGFVRLNWRSRQNSNLQPSGSKPGALSVELRDRNGVSPMQAGRTLLSSDGPLRAPLITRPSSASARP